jgi:hypothetical protein
MVELSDTLLKRARRVAREQGITLRALLEQGLRLAMKAQQAPRPTGYRMRTFAGDGRTDAFSAASWETVRDEVHRARS